MKLLFAYIRKRFLFIEFARFLIIITHCEHDVPQTHQFSATRATLQTVDPCWQAFCRLQSTRHMFKHFSINLVNLIKRKKEKLIKNRYDLITIGFFIFGTV